MSSRSWLGWIIGLVALLNASIIAGLIAAGYVR
jgi:hypothetical protein